MKWVENSYGILSLLRISVIHVGFISCSDVQVVSLVLGTFCIAGNK